MEKHIESATSERVDAAVAIGRISSADSKDRRRYVDHGSQQYQEQNYSSPQNTFTYEMGTFVVLTIYKEVSDSEHSFQIRLHVSKIPGECFVKELKMNWLHPTEDSEKVTNHFWEIIYMLENCCFFVMNQKAVKYNVSSFPRSDLQIKWTDEIETGTIYITLSGLTRENNLLLDFKEKIYSS